MSRKDPRHGGIIAGIFLAVVMVGLCVVIGGVILTRSIRVHTIETGDGAHVNANIAIDTPGGRLNIRSHDHMSAAAAGIPIYPGATRTNDQGSANIEWTSKDGSTDKSLYVFGGEYRTPDSVKRVVDFYRHELPALLIVSDHDETTRLEYKDGGIKRIISIRDDDGETRIGIASVGGRESN